MARKTVRHVALKELSYCHQVKDWLAQRYGEDEARGIWGRAESNYSSYLDDLPDYGGGKNGHTKAIYGGLMIFALYPALPGRPPIEELQEFVQNMFMGAFVRLGSIFDLNRPRDMWLIDKVFRLSGNRDRRDIKTWPDGLVNVDGPYDKERHLARYRFTQCPNAEFAKSHGLLHVLPVLCNCDFFGIAMIRGQLVRCGTCGNSDACDYLVMGNRNPVAQEWTTLKDESGFIVSVRKGDT